MRRIWKHRFRRGTLLLGLFLGLLAGIGLARTGYAVSGYWACLPALYIMVIWRKHTMLTMVFVVSCGMLLGWWRGSSYLSQLAVYQPLYYQKVVLTLRASEDAVYSKTKQLSFAAYDVTLDDGRQVAGKIQVSGFGVNAVFQGDEITVSGKLYPGFGPYQGRVSFAVLQVTAHHPSLVSEIRRRFIAGMQTALPEPLAPFAMGLLVGQRATLPDGTKQDLLMVGLTHIIAVSGYNLTIILNASQRLLGKRSKRVSTLLSLALIAVFLLLAGASASIVRAAIVSVLSIAAGYYGRSLKPLNLLALAAVITAWANPVYIWSDLSWYLSFLAFYGVMILAPLVQARWPARWHQSLIGGVALESICAETMTLPFVLYVFGQMSRIGLLANVLVVTLVPLAMLLGVIAGLAGTLAGSVAGWFAWPAVLLLNYMLDTAHLLAGLPHIFVEGIGLSLTQMLLLYGCVCGLTAVLWRKTRLRSGIITDTTQIKPRGLLT